MAAATVSFSLIITQVDIVCSISTGVVFLFNYWVIIVKEAQYNSIQEVGLRLSSRIMRYSRWRQWPFWKTVIFIKALKFGLNSCVIPLKQPYLDNKLISLVRIIKQIENSPNSATRGRLWAAIRRKLINRHKTLTMAPRS